MKKTVIKSAVITFCSLLIICCVGYFILMAVQPSMLSDFYKELGDKTLALKYAEKAHLDKPDNQQYLIDAIDRAIDVENYSKTARYCEEFFSGDFKVSSDEEVRYQVKYCIALTALDRGEDALEKAREFSVGYAEYNAFRGIISYAMECKNEEFLSEIRSELALFRNSYLSTLSDEAKQRISDDMEVIRKFLYE